MSEKESNVNEEQELDVNHLMQVRKEKLEELQQNGQNQYSRRNQRKI